jgi:hypothetical protein
MKVQKVPVRRHLDPHSRRKVLAFAQETCQDLRRDGRRPKLEFHRYEATRPQVMGKVPSPCSFRGS